LEASILAITQSAEPGVAAWRIYEDISVASDYDKVFFSSGSTAPLAGGCAKIFFRIRRNSATSFQMRSYTDWSIIDHAGSGESNAASLTLHDSIQAYYYFAGNEHAICAALSQSTSWFFLYGGETIRDFCKPGMAGRAFLASEALSGSSITFSVDRDLSNNLVTGSQGMIVAQTPSGSIRKGVAVSIAQITNVDGTEITMQMAHDEGWITKNGSKWRTMPEQMLKYRSAAFFARTECPEVLMGFQTADETQDVNGPADEPVQKVTITLDAPGRG